MLSARALVGHDAPTHAGARLVIDIIYILATIVFFALMVAYVAACDRLGRAADVDRGPKEHV